MFMDLNRRLYEQTQERDHEGLPYKSRAQRIFKFDEATRNQLSKLVPNKIPWDDYDKVREAVYHTPTQNIKEIMENNKPPEDK